MAKKILVVVGVLLAIGLVGSVVSGGGGRSDETSGAQQAGQEAEQSGQDAQKTARKDFDGKVDGIFYKSVNNDKTGNWRCFVYHSADQAQDIAADYYRAYFDGDGEIHALVNLGLKTTARVSYGSGQLYVDVFEYVEDEEHDAIAMFTGMPLASYIVNAETGAVEQV